MSARTDDIRKLMTLVEVRWKPIGPPKKQRVINPVRKPFLGIKGEKEEPKWEPMPTTMYTLLQNGKPFELPNMPGIYILTDRAHAERLAAKVRALGVELGRVEMKITPIRGE